MTADVETPQSRELRTPALGWRDYLAEFAGTALLLAGGLSAVVLFFAPGSPLPRVIPDENVRRLVTGILFAGTGTAVVYSPLGRRSGGHINPAVTLAFYRLGKMSTRSALWYVAMQISGAVVGALAVRLAWGGLAAQVRDGVTMPGRTGVLAALAALAAELVMTGLLVALILHFVDSSRLMPYTAIAAGLLVATLVFLAAPLSGTSLNPARSLGPAVVAMDVGTLWIYLVAPPLGALLAALAFRRARGEVACGKLVHDNDYSCGFRNCRYRRSTL
jgi:aquaporin Z